MGTFTKSLSRELGKNTGKWVSNKVFGTTGWATPRRHIIEIEQRKKQREQARDYKEKQKQIERGRREREKRLRQQEKKLAEREKQEMIESNNEEVREHNNYIDVIQSVHKSYSKAVDWSEIENQPEPEPVQKAEELTDHYRKYTDEQVEKRIEEAKKEIKLSLARLILGKLYTPKYKWLFKVMTHNVTLFTLIMLAGWCLTINQTFGLTIAMIVGGTLYLFKLGNKDFVKGVDLEKIISELEANRDAWYNEYLEEQEQAYNKYLQDKDDHKKVVEIAKGIKRADSQAFTYAINFFNPFEDLKEYGSDISFNASKDMILVDFFVHSEEVIPNTIKKVLHNGREVKEEQMPISRFHEIYQDYVCSCILRIVKEVFQLLPVNTVQINAKGTLLNSATGNQEEQTIVSVQIERDKLDSLNFDLLDPSDSMSNFDLNMDFKKTEGFMPVSEL